MAQPRKRGHLGRPLLPALTVVWLGLSLAACGPSRVTATGGEDSGGDVVDAAPIDDGGAHDAGDETTDDAAVGEVHAADSIDADAGTAVIESGSDADVDSTGEVDGTGDADAEELSDGETDGCRGPLPPTWGDDLVPDRVWRETGFSRCASSAHALVVPAGAAWWVEARGLPADARLFVYDARYIGAAEEGRVVPTPLMRGEFAGRAGEVGVELIAPLSGEYAAVVERDDGTTEAAYEVRAVCAAGCELETTRYPVLLVHGYAGIDTYFGVLDYFYDIHDPLEALGYDIRTPVTDPIATSERRADQLAEQVDEILVESQARRVNIIAHSQGGVDARLLVSGMGYADRVASVTTVATPHLGVPAILFQFFSLQDFTVEAMAAFNDTYVDDPGVRYWSWSARSCALWDGECQWELSGEQIETFLIATFNILASFGDNDGVVPTASMVWGEHLGQLSADHFDEVGQIADRSPEDDPFDHRAFYLSEVRRLASAGL